MANKKITDLPAGVRVRADDLMECVQSGVSNQISAEELQPGSDLPPATANVLDDEFDDVALDGKWTWVNQGGSTAVGSKGSLQFAVPFIASNSARLLYQAAPATPWEFTAKVALIAKLNTNYFFAGLMMMDAGSGKLITITIGHDSANKLSVFQWNSTTSVAAGPYGEAYAPRSTYLRIADDGTNLIFSYSEDGITFFPVYTQARNSFFTAGADRVGLVVNANHASLGCTGSFDWFRRTV